MAAQKVSGILLRAEIGGVPCSSHQTHIQCASSGPCSASSSPSLLGTCSPPSLNYQGMHSHSHAQSELGSLFSSRRGRLWSSQRGTAHPRGYRNVRVTAVASLGGLLGGLFKGNDTGEATKQQYAGAVASVNSLEAMISQLSDEDLRGKTAEFKARVARGDSLDSLLPGPQVIEARLFVVWNIHDPSIVLMGSLGI